MARAIPDTNASRWDIDPSDYELSIKQSNENFAKLQAISDAVDIDNGQIVGLLLSWQRADSYAYYVVAKERPLTLEHLQFCDGWTVERELIHGLTKSRILEIERSKREWKQLINGKRNKIKELKNNDY